MPAHMCAGQCTAAESVPSFHHGSPGHQIQVIKLDSKLYPLGHLTGPTLGFLCVFWGFI